MKLVGMLDSPYVRRVAVSLQRLGVPFEHHPLSVFRDFAAFSRINPVVKAPTLVCDDGLVLMDSGLIIEHAESLAGRSLMPADAVGRGRALRCVALSLAACEKSVQLVYERLRPAERQHGPWVERVIAQLQAALGALDDEVRLHPPPLGADTIGQAGITAAVAWRFITRETSGEAQAGHRPHLAALSARAESLPAFMAAPHGTGPVAQTVSQASVEPRP